MRGLGRTLALSLGLVCLLAVGPASAGGPGCDHGGGPPQCGGGGAGGGDDTLTRLWLEGFVDVPPGTLALPLGPADPAVDVVVTFGVPAVQVVVTITPDTRVRNDKGHEVPVDLTDGDRVQLSIQVVGDVLWARSLRVEEFPELKLQGVAQGVPGGALALPLGPGATAGFEVRLGGSTVVLPVVLTADTKLDPDTFTLEDGDLIQVKALVNDLQIVAVKLERVPDQEDE
jgi:hypothetical protein